MIKWVKMPNIHGNDGINISGNCQESQELWKKCWNLFEKVALFLLIENECYIFQSRGDICRTSLICRSLEVKMIY